MRCWLESLGFNLCNNQFKLYFFLYESELINSDHNLWTGSTTQFTCFANEKYSTSTQYRKWPSFPYVLITVMVQVIISFQLMEQNTVGKYNSLCARQHCFYEILVS